MKAIVAAAIGAALFLAPTLGHANEPRATFGGAYIGLNAGAAWGSAHYETDPGCLAPGLDAVFCNSSPDPSAVNGTAVASSGTGKLAPSGFTGGVQGGYNWKMGSTIVGGEADFAAFDLSQSATINGVFPQTFLGTAYALDESMSTDWIATIRGRLGIAVTPQLLLYATGGVAFTDFKFSSGYSDNAVDATFPGGSGSGSKSGVRAGWTLGGGGEWMLLDGRWSIKAEYLYVDFGSEKIAVPVSNTAAFRQTMEVDAALTAQIARAGLNYRF
jgi:outer membrane immunogenic protein